MIKSPIDARFQWLFHVKDAWDDDCNEQDNANTTSVFKNKEKIKHLKVQIIYHCNKTEEAKEVLLTVEEFYTRKLCTIMPFGLNDNITSIFEVISDFNFDHQLDF